MADCRDLQDLEVAVEGREREGSLASASWCTGGEV